MRDSQKHNPQRTGVPPKTREPFNSALLQEQLKKFPLASPDYDAFSCLYEYFLSAFACAQCRKGGEFYTPSGSVRLIVGPGPIVAGNRRVFCARRFESAGSSVRF